MARHIHPIQTAISILLLLLSMSVTSCSNDTAGNNRNNSIYYWRTTFSLSDKEKQLIDRHDITRMYMRFFDVNCPTKPVKGETVVPEATIKFLDSVPDNIEVVPTVYITTPAMQSMQAKEDDLAEKIVRRVNAICRKNNIRCKEIQLDCDWTGSTRRYFFRLCEAVKERLDSTQTLSSTIRLHQLTQTPPPVDKGVLMVYNTGNLMEMTSSNSIFSQEDIRPYLRDDRLARYRLPLDVAYPAYGWSVAYHPSSDGYRFFRLMRRTDFSSYRGLHQIGPNLYEASTTIDFSDGKDIDDKIYENYRIKIERPSAEEILKVKQLIDRQLNGKPHSNIIYHLDDSQLSHYSDYEISKIFTRN